MHINTVLQLAEVCWCVWPLSDNQTINFSYIILSAKVPSKYHMEKQELSFQFASVLVAKQQTGQ